jgi:carboxyl-terminal processing protease
MKILKSLTLLLTIAFLTTSCFEDIDDNAISDGSINNFVWKGMNSWYNWQLDVPDLSDTKDDNSNEYQSYLNQFTDPSDLFNSLKYQDGITDRFSWFVEDYIALQQQFQGITKSFGIEFQGVQINTNGDVILYVNYVTDDSPASDANIKRGAIINAINGTELNTSNFSSSISDFSNDNITLSFVSESGGTLTFLEDKTISSIVLTDNPVHFSKVFNDINGKKVGYLVYLGFRNSYNDELNEAFSLFDSENIDELILDLRHNGGGSVETSAYLSSMIHAGAGQGIFASLKFNSKHTNEDGSYNFEDNLKVYDSNGSKTGDQTINRLNTLDRLYVLISGNTASASEMVINGLKPYLPVKLVGETTYGKNVGSITLYDSPGTDYQVRSSANPSHTKAMQPIVFQIFNKNGESDYTQGFEPDIEIKESSYWNAILPFGDENEVVLKAALNDIRGFTTKSNITKKSTFSKPLDANIVAEKFKNEMYIGNEFFINK